MLTCAGPEGDADEGGRGGGVEEGFGDGEAGGAGFAGQSPGEGGAAVVAGHERDGLMGLRVGEVYDGEAASGPEAGTGGGEERADEAGSRVGRAGERVAVPSSLVEEDFVSGVGGGGGFVVEVEEVGWGFDGPVGLSECGGDN